jgi:hypothetical protein
MDIRTHLLHTVVLEGDILIIGKDTIEQRIVLLTGEGRSL